MSRISIAASNVAARIRSERKTIALVVGTLLGVPVVLVALLLAITIPETVASSVATDLHVMPASAHLLYEEYTFEHGHPVVSGEWHTCSEPPFRVGAFRIDLLNRKVLESVQENWEETQTVSPDQEADD